MRKLLKPHSPGGTGVVGMRAMRLLVTSLAVLALLLPFVFGANDPGHDTLYVLRIGNTNVTGSINITGNLTATLVQATSRFFGPNIDIRGDGTSGSWQNQIKGTTTNLEIDSSSGIILNGNTGTMVQVGTTSAPAYLNVTGALYQGNVKVCLANGTNCPATSSGANVTGSGTQNYVSKWTSTTGLGNSVVYDDGTNVGIGTTSPASALSVVRLGSGVTVGSAANNYGLVGFNREVETGAILNSTQPAYQFSNKGSQLLLEVYNASGGLVSANALVVSSTGNVGIGTTNPSQKLEVTGSTAAIRVNNTNAATFGNVEILSDTTAQTSIVTFASARATSTFGVSADANWSMLYSHGTASSGLAIGTFTAKPFILGTNNLERMRVDSAGNVGVGTTGPVVKLEVNSTVSGDVGAWTLTKAGAVGDVQNLLFRMSTNTSTVGTTAAIGAIAESVDANNTGTGLRFVTGQHSITGERMRITSAGNVGIGTTSPASRLHVSGGDLTIDNNRLLAFRNSSSDGNAADIVSSPTENDLRLRTQATERITILRTGEVGIGITSPGEALQVVGKINASTDVCITGGACLSTVGASGGGWTDSSNQVALTTAGDNISVGSAPTLFVDNTNGRVGIGTAAPSYKLSVNSTQLAVHIPVTTGGVSSGNIMLLLNDSSGGAGANAWQVLTRVSEDGLSIANVGDNAVRLHIDGSGNVGIGTTSPAAKLQINGAAGTQPNLRLNWSSSSTDFHNDYGLLDLVNTDITNNNYAAIDFNAYNTSGTLASRVASIAAVYTNHSPGGPTTTDLAFIVGNNVQERMRITSVGNVGIGTTGPAAPLHVNSSDIIVTRVQSIAARGPLVSFYNSSAQIGIIGAYSGFSGSGTDHTFTIASEAPNGIAFLTNGATTKKVVIDTAGNVGIGTTNPASALEINRTSSGDLLLLRAAGTTGLWQTLITNGSVRGFLGVADTAGTQDVLFTDELANAVGLRSQAALHLGSGTGVDLTIDTSGNVGIGTTAPFYPLDIASNAGYVQMRLSAPGSGTFSRIWYVTDNPVHWNVGARNDSTYAGGFSFENNNSGVWSSKLFVTTAGSVGINTTNPADTLSIAGTAGVISNGINPYVRIGDSTNDNMFLRWMSTDYGEIQTQLGGTPSGNLSLQRQGGNVGIGTTGPGYKLEVAGGSTDDVLKVTSTRNIANPAMFYLQHNRGTANAANADINQLIFAQDSNAAASAITSSIQQVTEDVTSITGGGLAFSTGGIGIAKERVRITKDGNVGIGTTAPSSNGKLHVNGSLWITNAGVNNAVRISAGAAGGANLIDSNYDTGGALLPLKLSANAGSYPSQLYLDTTGNVGIGTTSPSAKLTVNDTTNGAAINLIGRSTDDTASINFRATNDASTYAYIAPDTNEFRLYHNDGNMTFYPGGTEKVRITSGGNVGIGTTGPLSTLHVNSSSAAGSLRITNTTGSEHLFIKGSTGNVGIGTVTPLVKLHSASAASASTELLRLQSNTNSAEGNAVRLAFASQVALDGGEQRVNAAIDAVTTDIADSHHGELAFYTMVTGTLVERMRITDSGNVGIGTTAPARNLHINDTMRLQPRSAAPSNAAKGDLYVDSDSNELCFYDGSSWTGLKAAGSCA